MKRDARQIISIFAIVFIFFGWNGLMTLLSIIKETLIAFFPIFPVVAKQSIEDYLTSPYFITKVIIFILSSGFGIWVGKTGGKVIYLIISIAAALLSLISIFSNLL